MNWGVARDEMGVEGLGFGVQGLGFRVGLGLLGGSWYFLTNDNCTYITHLEAPYVP